VKGWRGGNLLTDKGEFVFSQLFGRYPIQSARLLEVVTLQLDESGEWLLNGHDLRMLQLYVPGGNRFYDITNDEDLRVYKGEIHAVAWVQKNSEGNITQLLDTILSFWKTAAQGIKDAAYIYSIKENTKASAIAKLVASLAVGLSSFGKSAQRSNPIWLTKFHPIAKNNPYTAGLEIALAQPASVPVEAVEPTKNKATQGCQPKPVARAENVVAPTKSAPEFFTSIKAAADYIGVTTRTILNWKKRSWLKVEQNVKKIRIAKTDLDKCKNRQ